MGLSKMTIAILIHEELGHVQEIQLDITLARMKFSNFWVDDKLL